MRTTRLADWLDSVKDDMLERVRKERVPLSLKLKLAEEIRNMGLSMVASHSALVDCKILDGGRIRETGMIILCERSVVLLLHELVHRVGGTELDSEITEWLVYPNLATPPTEDDVIKFDRDGSVFYDESVIEEFFNEYGI